MCPAAKPDLLHLPDAWWMVPRSLIIFDHVTREIMLVVLAPAEDGYHQAAGRIDELGPPSSEQARAAGEDEAARTGRRGLHLHAGGVYGSCCKGQEIYSRR